jgi:gephyrin
MSKSQLKAAILVISTTAAKDPSTDSSGDLLKEVFAKDGAGQWEVVETKIVGDDILAIQRSVTEWTDGENPVNLIISTGGTGFATFDNTPEVWYPVILESVISLTSARQSLL